MKVLPVDELDLLSEHGRGMMIAKFQFDLMEYQGAGNIVRIQKIPRHTGGKNCR